MEGLGAAGGQPAQTSKDGDSADGRQDTAVGSVHVEVSGIQCIVSQAGLLQAPQLQCFNHLLIRSKGGGQRRQHHLQQRQQSSQAEQNPCSFTCVKWHVCVLAADNGCSVIASCL